jgi:hypothetical protein
MHSTDIWLRVVGNAMSGAAFGLLAGISMWLLLRWKTIGHRLLLIFATVVFLVRSFAGMAAAMDLYLGGKYFADGMHLTAALVTVVFATYAMAARHDLLVTLRSSEAQDKKRAERLKDNRQVAVQLNYLARNVYERSKGLVIDDGVRSRS